MPLISIIGFGLFALIALYNAISVIKSTKERHYSVTPFLGLVFFILAMMNLDNRPIWLWLLVFLDIGTLMFVVSLPSFIVDARREPCLMFKNNQETLTLYCADIHQSFCWGWTADELPMGVVSLSGDWRQAGDVFTFYANDNNPYFKAVLQDNILTVVETDDEYLQFKDKKYQQAHQS